MKKRLLALLLIIAMLTSMIPAAAAAGFPFTDVKESDWFYEYVDFVWSKGYFEGVSDTKYDPQGTMTRAMFVTVLARLDEAEVDDSVSAFDDVPVNTWYTGSVTWAAKNKIVDGVAEGKFNPNGPVTREQMCAIMDRYINYYGAANSIEHVEDALVESFKDADKISSYAVDCVENCRVYGLVDGFEDGTFRPTQSSTRAQVAAVISRLAWVVKGESGGSSGGGGGGGGGGGETTYTVTWKNWDGTVLEKDTDVKKNATPSYDGATPTRPADAQYSYEFAGWTPALAPVTGDITYTATYTPTTRTYTVTWKNWDGTVLETDTNVPYGTIPEYNGAIPVKAGNAQYAYTFLGWNNALTAVTGDVTYIAQFTADVNEYTVIWKNYDGTVLETDYNVPYGTIPEYNGATPTRPADTQYTYTFAGWDIAVNGVTGDITYTAQYNTTINQYTITWLDGNGAVLKTELLGYGTMPAYTGTPPTKTATAQYTYTYNGSWAPAIVAVAGDATYTALFDATVNTYTVTWKNYDGTVLETDTNVPYGTIPHYDGATPVKAGNAQYAYTFLGWDNALTEVIGDITYTAQFTADVNEYTVTWKNYDGTVLETDYNVPYGTTPEYNGAIPTRPADAQFTYTFGGWDIAVSDVTGDVTYTAQYNTTTNTYTVTWKNEDGTVLETDYNVPYGEMPTFDSTTPVKATTPEFTYTFSGWTPDVDTVTGDAEYTAQFASTVRNYTHIWFNADSAFTPLEIDFNVPYGTTPEYNGVTPTLPADAQYTYTFVGWWDFTDDANSLVYHFALYTNTTNTYTVIWQNEDGTVLETDTVAYGDTPSYDGATPTKAADAQYSYVFSGWTPAVTTVTENTEYTAQFTSSERNYTHIWWNVDPFWNTFSWLETDDAVPYSATPSYDGAVPTLPADAQYTYTFTGFWWDNVDDANSTVHHYTLYYYTTNTYPITWVDGDGNTLATTDVAYGHAPTYTGAVPTKTADAQYTYTFNGTWYPALTTVTGPATYTAQFDSTVNEYTVIWKNEDGTVLETDTVAYGETPSYDNATPTKAADAQYTYTFDKWTPDVVAVTGAAEYTATYTYTVNTYTLTFHSNGGTGINAVDYLYGELASAPASPYKKDYAFGGWYLDDVTFTMKADFPITMVEDVDLYAKWIECEDYIGMAVNASMTEVQNDYLKYVDVAKDKADNRFVDASNAFDLSKFVYSAEKDPSNLDSRPQTVNAELTLAANFHRDAIVNAAYYAGVVTVGAVVRRDEVKAFVDPYIDEINAWFKENSIREVISNVDREAIIDSVYEALKNRTDDIWENFRDADGVYYTGGVTLSAGRDDYEYSSKVELPNSTTNKRTYAKEMAKIAAKLAVAMTKDIYHQMTIARDWSDELVFKATLTFTFDDSAAYVDHTKQFPHVYPFDITMTLDGNGYVFYKFEGHVPHVKLVIDQKTQDRYDYAVNAAVEKLVTSDAVVNVMRSEMNDLINRYIDLTDPSNPFAAELPAEITNEDKAVLNGALRGIVKTWFYNNSNISLTNSDNDGDVRASYFYRSIWLGEDIERNDDIFIALAQSDLELFDAKIREIAIREAKELAPDALSEAVGDAKVEFDTNILPTINTGIKNELNNKIKESVKNAFAAELKNQFIETNHLDPANPLHQTYINDFVASTKYTNAINDFVASPEYNEAVTDFIESPEYEEALAEVVQTPEYASLMDDVLDRIFDEVERTINNRFTHYTYTYDITPVRNAANINNWASVLENALVNDVDLITALATNEVDKMLANDELPTSDIIVDTITDLIENTKYMEILQKATNLRRFDTIDDITLGNLATVLGNKTAQNALDEYVTDKRESYLLRLTDQLRRLPEGASIIVTNDTTGEKFTIDAKLVDDVRTAEDYREVCDAFAAIFATKGIADMSLSEFYEGQIVTFKYNTHTASCGLWVEAK